MSISKRLYSVRKMYKNNVINKQEAIVTLCTIVPNESYDSVVKCVEYWT